MSGKKPELKYIPWSKVVETTLKLGSSIHEKFKPDIIVAIAKGGLIPARILSDMLGVDEIGYVEVKFYKSVGVTMEKPFIKTLAISTVSNRNVLIVDDVVDSGRTMQLVVNVLSSLGAKSVKTFALFIKPWSTFIPDYFDAVTESWIIFPWEVCEVLREGITVDHEEFKNYSNYCVT